MSRIPKPVRERAKNRKKAKKFPFSNIHLEGGNIEIDMASAREKLQVMHEITESIFAERREKAKAKAKASDMWDIDELLFGFKEKVKEKEKPSNCKSIW